MCIVEIAGFTSNKKIEKNAWKPWAYKFFLWSWLKPMLKQNKAWDKQQSETRVLLRVFLSWLACIKHCDLNNNKIATDFVAIAVAIAIINEIDILQ